MLSFVYLSESEVLFLKTREFFLDIGNFLYEKNISKNINQKPDFLYKELKEFILIKTEEYKIEIDDLYKCKKLIEEYNFPDSFELCLALSEIEPERYFLNFLIKSFSRKFPEPMYLYYDLLERIKIKSLIDVKYFYSEISFIDFSNLLYKRYNTNLELSEKHKSIRKMERTVIDMNTSFNPFYESSSMAFKNIKITEEYKKYLSIIYNCELLKRLIKNENVLVAFDYKEIPIFKMENYKEHKTVIEGSEIEILKIVESEKN